MATRGCCVPNCSKNSKDGVSLYVFPKDVKVRKQWIASIAKASQFPRWSPAGTSLKVCSAHFQGGRKTSDSNVPTVFTTEKNDTALVPKTRMPSARQMARKALSVKRPPSPLVQVKKAPSPTPKQQAAKKPPARAQPKKAGKAQPGKQQAKKQRVRSQSLSVKDEMKQEGGLISPVNMAPNVLARFIREDHLYCLPKSDSVTILQKLLEEKTKVVETLLDRIHSLEIEVEEKELKLKQMQQQVDRAQSC